MKRSKRILRVVSFILLQTFIAQQISFADVLAPLAAKQELQSKPEVGLAFPDSVASIEDAYKNGGNKLFYLIQDAHTNESGQYNLSKALDVILTKEADLKYVFTEAGLGDDSLSFLKPYRTPKDRDRVAKAYIKKGLLHGHEYLNLMSDRDFTLWGVENPDLYVSAVENYRQVAKERERFDLYLRKIEATTETLKNRLLNPSLQTFDNERKAYREESLPLTSYFTALWREATLQNISLASYPHLSLLKSLKEKEEKLDFAQANKEHQKAVQSLPPAAQSELKELTDASENKADKVLGRGQKETQAYFLALEEKLGAGSSELGAKDYAELFKYFDYLKLAKQVEAKEVLKEVDSLENTVLDSLSRSEDEKTLIKCENVLFYLKKLFYFTLTPEEYVSYKEDTRNFSIEHLTGFLNKKIMDLGTYYDRSLFLEKGYDQMLAHAEGFYELTKTRDEYFIQTALEKMDKESAKKAVLVTGGFHTANLKALLKEKGISFVSVTPQVWQATNMKKYESLLLSQTMTLKPISIPAPAKVSTIMTEPLLEQALAGHAGARLALLDIGNGHGLAYRRQEIGDREDVEGLSPTAYPLSAISGARLAGTDPRPDGSISITFVNPKEYSNQGENLILNRELKYLTSVIKKLILQEEGQEALQKSTRITVRNLADTNVSRIFLVEWPGKKYVVKKSAWDFYNGYIGNQWNILQKLNSDRSRSDIAQPIMRGSAVITHQPGHSENISYLVTNYFEDQDLSQRVSTKGRFNDKKVIDFGLKLAKLVKFVHRKQVVIRHLKPENIIVATNGTVALHDFNVSMPLDYDWKEDPDDFKNTIKHGYVDDGWEYFTRPQERNKPDAMSDVFAIGMVLFFASTGKEYYQGEYGKKIGLEEVKNKVLRAIIGHAIAQRDMRYKNVDELIADLEKNTWSLNFMFGRFGARLAAIKNATIDEVVKAVAERLKPSELNKDGVIVFTVIVDGKRIFSSFDLRYVFNGELTELAIDVLIKNLKEKNLPDPAFTITEKLADGVLTLKVTSSGARLSRDKSSLPVRKTAISKTTTLWVKRNITVQETLQLAELFINKDTFHDATINVDPYKRKPEISLATTEGDLNKLKEHLAKFSIDTRFNVAHRIVRERHTLNIMPPSSGARLTEKNLADTLEAVDVFINERPDEQKRITVNSFPGEKKHSYAPITKNVLGWVKGFLRSANKVFGGATFILDKKIGDDGIPTLIITPKTSGASSESLDAARDQGARLALTNEQYSEGVAQLLRAGFKPDSADQIAAAFREFITKNKNTPVGKAGSTKIDPSQFYKELIDSVRPMTFWSNASSITSWYLIGLIFSIPGMVNVVSRVWLGDEFLLTPSQLILYLMSAIGILVPALAKYTLRSTYSPFQGIRVWTIFQSGDPNKITEDAKVVAQKTFEELSGARLATTLRVASVDDMIKELSKNKRALGDAPPAIIEHTASRRELITYSYDGAVLRNKLDEYIPGTEFTLTIGVHISVGNGRHAYGFTVTPLTPPSGARLARTENATIDELIERILSNKGKTVRLILPEKDTWFLSKNSQAFSKETLETLFKDYPAGATFTIEEVLVKNPKGDVLELRVTGPTAQPAGLSEPLSSLLYSVPMLNVLGAAGVVVTGFLASWGMSAFVWSIPLALGLLAYVRSGFLQYKITPYLRQGNLAPDWSWLAADGAMMLATITSSIYHPFISLIPFISTLFFSRSRNAELSKSKMIEVLASSSSGKAGTSGARLARKNAQPFDAQRDRQAIIDKLPDLFGGETRERAADNLIAAAREYQNKSGKTVTRGAVLEYVGESLSKKPLILFFIRGVQIYRDNKKNSRLYMNAGLGNEPFKRHFEDYFVQNNLVSGPRVDEKNLEKALEAVDSFIDRHPDGNGWIVVSPFSDEKEFSRSLESEKIRIFVERHLRYADEFFGVATFTINEKIDDGIPTLTITPKVSGARLAATIGSDSIPDAKVRQWVNEMAAYLGADPDKFEIVDAADDARLLDEEIAAGNLIKLPNGNYYARSHEKDVARSVERTMVATSDPGDKGLYNNWRDAASVRPELDKRMKGAVKPGEKIYVIPHLMGPEGSDLSKAVVQITNSRSVALNTIRMARVGAPAWNTIAKTGEFIKGVHYTGDLDNIKRTGKDDDDRFFVIFPETREIWSFGSAYGGNALLGKKFVSLRQASWDGLKEGWHAEHMFVLEIEDIAGAHKGRVRRVAGAYPSASGKTNSAMMKLIKTLEKKYKVFALSDDIVWMREKVDPATGRKRLYARNPEKGFFGVVPGTNDEENPNFMLTIGDGSGTIFTNVAYNEITQELWWEGKSQKPTDLDGWLNWKGEKITEANVDQPWAHPNSRATAAAENAPNLSPSFNDPDGVPIDIILFGGRDSSREPLIRIPGGPVEGVVDGASMVVEATAAAEGKAGVVEADPMAQRPFFSYPEDKYFQHWFETMEDMGPDAPTIVHVNWFRRDPVTKKFMWPGFGYNLFAMLLALDFDPNSDGWVKTPIGYIPTTQAFYNLGLTEDEVTPEVLEKLLSVGRELWLREMDRRDAYFKDMETTLGRPLPSQIAEVNSRIREDLEAMPASGARLAQKWAKHVVLEASEFLKTHGEDASIGVKEAGSAEPKLFMSQKLPALKDDLRDYFGDNVLGIEEGMDSGARQLTVTLSKVPSAALAWEWAGQIAQKRTDRPSSGAFGEDVKIKVQVEGETGETIFTLPEYQSPIEGLRVFLAENYPQRMFETSEVSFKNGRWMLKVIPLENSSGSRLAISSAVRDLVEFVDGSKIFGNEREWNKDAVENLIVLMLNTLTTDIKEGKKYTQDIPEHVVHAVVVFMARHRDPATEVLQTIFSNLDPDHQGRFTDYLRGLANNLEKESGFVWTDAAYQSIARFLHRLSQSPEELQPLLPSGTNRILYAEKSGNTSGARLATAGLASQIIEDVLRDNTGFYQPAGVTEDKIVDVENFLKKERLQGRFLRRLHTPEQIAGVRPKVAGTRNITNYTAMLFNQTLRDKHFRNATTIANFGVDSAVMADAVASASVQEGKVLRQDFVHLTDHVDGLFSELVKNGYLDKNGIVQKKFLDLGGALYLNELSPEFSDKANEVYLIIMDRLYQRIEGIYNGGWAAQMRAGRSDQARDQHSYLGELPAQISTHFIRHAAAQEVALSKLSPEARAKYRPINYYLPLFADADEGHLKIKEMVQTMLTMGEEESLISALHIEDQAHGCKKCGHMSGKVLDGEDQWIRTLNNARFQLDVMGMRVMIVARTDAEAAEWITSTKSGNDQKFLLGATKFETAFQAVRAEELALAETNDADAATIAQVEAGLVALKKFMQNEQDSTRIRAYHDVISAARALGLEAEELQRIHEYWKKMAGLMRIEEVVAQAIQNNPGQVHISVEEWKQFIASIPRSSVRRQVDFLRIVKDKAREIGVNVYSDAEWGILEKESPASLKDRVAVLWDHDLTSSEENSRTIWMIDSGLEMAISRNTASLPYADIQWFEQHHPHIGEVKIWATALDRAAIRLLEEEDFYGLLSKKNPKPKVLEILDTYLKQRPENPEYFLTSLKQLMSLGISKQRAINLIQAVSRLKSNNTSPSFVWPEAMSETNPGQKMSDEEKRNFLKEQGKYVQFQFATYWGSMLLHILTRLYVQGGIKDPEEVEILKGIFENGYLRDGMLTVSQLQYLGRKHYDGFALNSQQYAGTALMAAIDAAGSGQQTVLAASGGKGDTMVIGGNTKLKPTTQFLIKFGSPRASGARLAIEARNDAKVGDVIAAYPDIFTPQVLDVLLKLTERFSSKREALMESRNALRLERQQGKASPDFRKADELIPQTDGAPITVQDAREGRFFGQAVPRDLQRQFIQGTGPAASLRNVAYALLSGADGWMFDGEDALGQTDTMSLDNIRNLKKAVAKDPEFLKLAVEMAKELDAKGELNKTSSPEIWNNASLTFEEKVYGQLDFTTKIFRARGLHLDDRQLEFNGEAIPGSIVDTVLYLVNTGDTLLKNGSTPTLYLPKIQNYEQAALWNEMLSAVEKEMGWTEGTVRVFVLVEQVDAALQLMEIRAALGKHFVGFNTGRWDYIHSVTDAMIGNKNFVEPDISVITMTYPFMAAYEKDVRIAANITDLDRNTALWIGGMEPQIPVGTEEAVKLAMERAVAGKERERNAGASGAWVAHWKMVPVVRPVWADNLGGKKNLMEPSNDRISYTKEHLAQFFELRAGDPVTEKGIADAISVDLQYVNAYLVGRAAVAIKPASEFQNDSILFLMEDAATSEIRGGWLWELLNKKAVITDGRFAGQTFTPAIFQQLMEKEFQRLVNEPDAKKVFPETKATTLPVAKYILQAYVGSHFKGPWLIDLSNAALQAPSFEEAARSVDAYITYLNENHGRITHNLRFEPAYPVIEKNLPTIEQALQMNGAQPAMTPLAAVVRELVLFVKDSEVADYDALFKKENGDGEAVDSFIIPILEKLKEDVEKGEEYTRAIPKNIAHTVVLLAAHYVLTSGESSESTLAAREALRAIFSKLTLAESGKFINYVDDLAGKSERWEHIPYGSVKDFLEKLPKSLLGQNRIIYPKEFVFEELGNPQVLPSVLGKFGLKVAKVEATSLDDRAVPAGLLDDRLAAFGLSGAVAEALGSIFFAGQGKGVKDLADGNAVYFAEQTILETTKIHPDIAVVVIGDEGVKDDSFSLELGALYVNGQKTEFEDIRKLEILLQDLRSKGATILYYVGDALENTNGLFVSEAASQPTNSSALFSFYIETPETRLGQNQFLNYDKNRIGGVTFVAPNEAGVTPFDLPSVALFKIANSLEENLGFFINNTNALYLGPRAADLEKAGYGVSWESNRHHAINADALELKKKYPGFKIITPGDGSLGPIVFSALGIQQQTDGRNLIVFGRGGSTEARAAQIVIANTPNARFPHAFVSTTATNTDFSEDVARNFSEDEIDAFTVTGVPESVYLRNRSTEDIRRGGAKGVFALSSVTGASAGQFNDAIADLYRRVTVDEAAGTITVSTLLSTPEGAFIVRITLKSNDLADSKRRIERATPAAREYLDGKASGDKSGARLASLTASAAPAKQFANRVREFLAVPVPVETEAARTFLFSDARLAVSNFLVATANAQLADGATENITILFNKDALFRIGVKLEGNKLRAISPELFPDFQEIDLSESRVAKKGEEVKVSFADLMMLRKQERLARETALDGLLQEVDAKIKVVHVVDPALLGDLANGHPLMLLAAEAYELSQKDHNFRVKLDTEDASVITNAQLRLAQLEVKMKLPQGALTDLFRLDGFKETVRLHVQAPDTASLQDEGARNFVLNPENLSGFALDLATITARLAEKNLRDDRYISAYSMGLDPSVKIESDKLVSVIMGRANAALRRLYALLPKIGPVDLRSHFRLAEMIIRSVGRSA